MQRKIEVTDLLGYKNRQIVLNFYFDEALVDRESFYFHHIEVDGRDISFLKNDQVVYTLHVDQRNSIVSDSTFPNFFLISDDKKVIEIYFP